MNNAHMYLVVRESDIIVSLQPLNSEENTIA